MKVECIGKYLLHTGRKRGLLGQLLQRLKPSKAFPQNFSKLSEDKKSDNELFNAG